MTQTKLFINNEFVEGVKGGHVAVVNPCTEEVICKISEATEGDVNKAVEAAEKAFPVWISLSFAEKQKLFFGLA